MAGNLKWCWLRAIENCSRGFFLLNVVTEPNDTMANLGENCPFSNTIQLGDSGCWIVVCIMPCWKEYVGNKM